LFRAGTGEEDRWSFKIKFAILLSVFAIGAVITVIIYAHYAGKEEPQPEPIGYTK